MITWGAQRTALRLLPAPQLLVRCIRDRAVCEESKGTKRSKLRLDELCVRLYPQYSRNVISSFIAQGKVLVNGQPITKAGHQVKSDAKVLLKAEVPKYVCRAGHKLEAALEHFNVCVEGKVVLDAGLSTGGFSDCLLQNGAKQVFGVDVGYGQVAERVRVDPRMVVMERCNLRHLQPQDLPVKVDLVTLDLAFISVLKVMPAVMGVLQPGGAMVVLIKPQFEAGKDQVGRGGVVKDPQVHKEVIQRVTEGVEQFSFHCEGVIESPLKGDKSSNTEFLAYFTHQQQEVVSSPVSTRQ